jgi:hypothetical protein
MLKNKKSKQYLISALVAATVITGTVGGVYAYSATAANEDSEPMSSQEEFVEVVALARCF